MRLDQLRRNWNELGRDDPLWAVATADQYRGGQWNSDEFFATGRDQVAGMLKTAENLGFTARGSAMDFGCGVGRLTQALAGHFEQVVGVDIAPTMIEHAQAFELNEICEFVLNDRPDLSCFDDGIFDLVYSEITLMHMRPEYGLAYIQEFLRVCKPGGMVVFQLPEVTRKQRVRGRIPERIWAGVTALRTLRQPRMEIYGVARKAVAETIGANGGHVVAVERLERAPSIRADNFRYFAIPTERADRL